MTETVVVAEAEGVRAEDTVGLDTVGAAVPVCATEGVSRGDVEYVWAEDAVAKDSVGPGDPVPPGDTDTEEVVVVDWEAGRVAPGEPLPSALGVVEAEAQAEEVGPPEMDPVPLPRADTEGEWEVWGLRDALGDTVGVREGAGEREEDRVPVFTPL